MAGGANAEELGQILEIHCKQFRRPAAMSHRLVGESTGNFSSRLQRFKAPLSDAHAAVARLRSDGAGIATS
jgi:hypothetical protein